jgi:BirA family transcriptional regulator, biotin operon repressor / biotin---[acetyl-CoA-carboxylase] ligase
MSYKSANLVKLKELNCIKNTLFVGKVLKYMEQIPSTNIFLLEQLQDVDSSGVNALQKPQLNVPIDSFFPRTPLVGEGTVVYTYNQTAGRGQYGNRWESEAGKNIAMSILLKPRFLEARQQFQLNKAISLAVHDVCTPYTEGGVSVKWANDIFIGDKKIAGILIQNNISGTRLEASVIGIGINVNQLNFQDLPNASSLKLETGKTYILEDIVEAICQAVEKRFWQLKSGYFEQLDEEYLAKLYRYGQDAIYQKADDTYFQGKIVGISETGKLCLETKLGLAYFGIKEIKFVL